MAGPLDDPKNKKILEGFIIEHAPLINFHANKLQRAGLIPPGIEADDLHMAGLHGLIDALHKYDPAVAEKNGKKFTDYAHSRIRGMMLDHVKDAGGIPKHLITQAKNLKALEGQMNPVKTSTAPQPPPQSAALKKPGSAG